MRLPSVDDVDDLPGWVGGFVVLGLGVSLAGLADYAVTAAGYPGAAAYVWTLGYVGTVMVLYMAYLRDVELSPDAGTTDPDAGTTDPDTGDRRS